MASATNKVNCEDAEEQPLEGSILLWLAGIRDAQSQAEIDAVAGAYIAAYNAAAAATCNVPGGYYRIDTVDVITNPEDVIGLPSQQRSRELGKQTNNGIQVSNTIAWLKTYKGGCRRCKKNDKKSNDVNARRLTWPRPPRPPRPSRHPEEQCPYCDPPPKVTILTQLNTEIQQLVDSGVLTTVTEATDLVELEKVECSTNAVDITGTIVFDAEFDLATATQEQKDTFLEDAKDTYNSYNLLEDEETCDTTFRRITQAVIDEEASTTNELVVRYEGLCRGCEGTGPLFDDFTSSSSTVRRHNIRRRLRFLQDATDLCLCPIGFTEDRPVTSNEYQTGLEAVIEQRGDTTLIESLSDISDAPLPTEPPTESPTGGSAPTPATLTLGPRTAIPTIPVGPAVPCVDGNIIEGTDGPDTLLGTPCADIIIGKSGDDLIIGLGGDDTIMGGDGQDTIVGGIGNDAIRGGEGADLIDGNDGIDTISGGGDADNIHGGAGGDKILGDSGSDTLIGGIGSDDIVGGEGKDAISGDGGNDKIQGNDGDDILIGGTGSDTILGGNDNDLIDAGDGSDQVSGGTGGDTINAGPGFDTVAASAGNDVIFGASGADFIQGEDGDDFVSGGNAGDLINGGKGIDTVNGDGGNDTVLNGEVGGP